MIFRKIIFCHKRAVFVRGRLITSQRYRCIAHSVPSYQTYVRPRERLSVSKKQRNYLVFPASTENFHHRGESSFCGIPKQGVMGELQWLQDAKDTTE